MTLLHGGGQIEVLNIGPHMNNRPPFPKKKNDCPKNLGDGLARIYGVVYMYMTI